MSEKLQQSYQIIFMFSLNLNTLCLLFFLAITTNSQQQPHTHIVPIFGNLSLAYYYVNIYIGNPSLKQSVLLDTGSFDLAVPCVECIQCSSKHKDPFYDYTKSSTSNVLDGKSCDRQTQDDRCYFEVMYYDNSSIEGFRVKDQIRLDGYKNLSPQVKFGCIYKQQKSISRTITNGIYGIGPRQLNPLISKLTNKHKDSERTIFSICLGINSGAMSIGKTASDLHSQKYPDVSVRYYSSSPFYSLVNVENITINERVISHKIDLRFRQVIVDTGTTFTLFPKNKYTLIAEALKEYCKQSDKCKLYDEMEGYQCYKLGSVFSSQSYYEIALQVFPTIDISINKYIAKWGPQRYLMQEHVNSDLFCLAIQGIPDDMYILGANWMVQRDFVFHLRNTTIDIYDHARCNKEQEKIQKFGYFPTQYYIQYSFLSSLLKIIQVFMIIGLIGIFSYGIWFFQKKYHERKFTFFLNEEVNFGELGEADIRSEVARRAEQRIDQIQMTQKSQNDI